MRVKRFCKNIKLSRLISVCLPAVYTFSADTRSIGASPQTSYTTRQACLDGCTATPTCLGVDMDSNSGTFCWFHTNAAALANTQPGVNVEQAVLVDRCPQQPESTSKVTTNRVVSEFSYFYSFSFQLQTV